MNQSFDGKSTNRDKTQHANDTSTGLKDNGFIEPIKDDDLNVTNYTNKSSNQQNDELKLSTKKLNALLNKMQELRNGEFKIHIKKFDDGGDFVKK